MGSKKMGLSCHGWNFLKNKKKKEKKERKKERNFLTVERYILHCTK